MLKITQKKLLLVAASSLVILGEVCSLPAKADGFKQLYSLGDSYSDKGNLFNLTGGFPPPPYFEGRSSNGPLWVDYLADAFQLDPLLSTEYANISPTPKLKKTDGINFAIAGDESTGILAQVNDFTNIINQNKEEPEEAVYTLLGGANDFLNLVQSPTFPSLTNQDLEDTYTQTVDNITTVLMTLAEEAKAKDILLLDMPTLGDVLPLANSLNPSQNAALNFLSEGYNNYLDEQLQELSLLFPKTDITLFSIKNLVDNVIEEPEKFGFINVTDGCLIVACSNPDDYLYWDNVHVTTKGHHLIAKSVLDILGFEDDETFVSSSTVSFSATPFAKSLASSFTNFGPSRDAIVNANTVSVPESNSTLGLLTLGFLGASVIIKIK